MEEITELEKLEEETAFGKSKVGITRKSKSLSKKAVKTQKKSRKVNKQRKNKKNKSTGSKRRK